MPPDNREKTTKTPKRNQKTILMVVAVVMLLLSLATLMHRQRAAALPCTNNLGGLLDRSIHLFDPEGQGAVDFEKYEELSAIATEIERQPNYDQDINCLYITANYHMYQDAVKAESILSSIKSLHSEGQEVSDAFAGAGVDRLEYHILVRKTQEEETAQNTFHIQVDESGSE